MKASIKLKLKIKDVEVELTREQIKELKLLLDDIFPQKEVVREWYPQPYIYPTYPQWTYTYTNDSTFLADTPRAVEQTAFVTLNDG
jgi:hypothetical protein